MFENVRKFRNTSSAYFSNINTIALPVTLPFLSRDYLFSVQLVRYGAKPERRKRERGRERERERERGRERENIENRWSRQRVHAAGISTLWSEPPRRHAYPLHRFCRTIACILCRRYPFPSHPSLSVRLSAHLSILLHLPSSISTMVLIRMLASRETCNAFWNNNIFALFEAPCYLLCTKVIRNGFVEFTSQISKSRCFVTLCIHWSCVIKLA